jgi:hypothetical protein
LSILILSRFARNRHFDGALLEKHFQTRCNIRARIKLHLLVDVDVIKFSIDRVTAFHFETDTPVYLEAGTGANADVTIIRERVVVFREANFRSEVILRAKSRAG